MSDEIKRLRRLRRTDSIRALVAETRLDPARFVLPLFVRDGISSEEPIASLPGHMHWPAERVAVIAKEAESVGIPGVIVFGVPDRKDARASRAHASDGPSQRAIEAIKSSSSLVVFADTCLCSFTETGHCGVFASGSQEVDNDASVELIVRTALAQAAAGADFVAPSDMMDGRVGAIRRALDAGGFAQTGIMSYAAKYASAFYGPFRDAASSAPSFGDRRGYQLDPRERRQALASIERDLAEGADMVLVKPALPSLDVIREARDRFDAPVGAYNVSGEYAMIRAAADRGWIDGPRAVMEVLTAIARAGADFIITYHALDAARWLAAR